MKNLICSAIVEFTFVKNILTILLYSAYLQLHKLYINLIQSLDLNKSDACETSIGAHLLILLINTLCVRELIFLIILTIISLFTQNNTCIAVLQW